MSAKSYKSVTSQKQIQNQQQYVKGVVYIDKIQIREFPEVFGSSKLYPQLDFSLGLGGKVTPAAKQTCNYDYVNDRIELSYDPDCRDNKTQLRIKVYKNEKQEKDNYIGTETVDILPSLNKQIPVDITIRQQGQSFGRVMFNMKYVSQDMVNHENELQQLKSKRQTDDQKSIKDSHTKEYSEGQYEHDEEMKKLEQ
ncbi:MAG: hypothetical protein EZS28_052331, partial [Streblomastix strix]